MAKDGWGVLSAVPLAPWAGIAVLCARSGGRPAGGMRRSAPRRMTAPSADRELAIMLGRPVDVVSKRGLSRHLRERVLQSREVLYGRQG